MNSVKIYKTNAKYRLHLFENFIIGKNGVRNLLFLVLIMCTTVFWELDYIFLKIGVLYQLFKIHLSYSMIQKKRLIKNLWCIFRFLPFHFSSSKDLHTNHLCLNLMFSNPSVYLILTWIVIIDNDTFSEKKCFYIALLCILSILRWEKSM